MNESFTRVARSLLETGTSIAPVQKEVGATKADLAGVAEFFARLATESHTLGTAIGPPWTRVSPPGTTALLVFAPSCAARVVAEHVAACLGAGNAVQVALFEPAEPLLLIVFAILRELLPERFAVLSEGTGWVASALEDSIVVVTEVDAFLNSTPWIHFRGAATAEPSLVGLFEFYSELPARAEHAEPDHGSAL